MTQDAHLSNQRRIALSLWREYLDTPDFYQFDRWLSGRLKQEKKFGKRDRLRYAEILFGLMRHAYLAGFILFMQGRVASATLSGLRDRYSDGLDSAERLRRRWRDLPADALLDLAGWRQEQEAPGSWPLGMPALAPELAETAAEVQQLAGTDDLHWQLLWAGLPLSYGDALAARAQHEGWSADQCRAFIERQNTRPPLWLRINQPAQREAILADLRQHYEVLVEDGDALAVRGTRGIYDLASFEQGLVEIQDHASQQIGRAVAAQPGERLWDACAGGGGKTLQLAASLHSKGVVYATDIRADKLDEIKRRARKAGFSNIRTQVWDGSAPLAFSREIANHGGFDAVLVDAPCSSSGTWRRNPDARFRELGRDLPGLTRLQGQLLTQAAKGVRAGGRLIYGTCSWRLEENEEVVQAFLAEHPEFTLVSSRCQTCLEVDSDSMFAAVMVKRT